MQRNNKQVCYIPRNLNEKAFLIKMERQSCFVQSASKNIFYFFQGKKLPADNSKYIGDNQKYLRHNLKYLRDIFYYIYMH